MGGGYLATGISMAVTYSAGWLLTLSGSLGDAWAHVTPGQASLVIGLMVYGTQNGPKFYHWAARQAARAKRHARR